MNQTHYTTPPPPPFFSEMAQNMDLRCVLLSDPSTFGAGGPNQNTSRIQLKEAYIPFHIQARSLDRGELGARQHAGAAAGPEACRSDVVRVGCNVGEIPPRN